jgi:hypothetical protein
MKKTIEANTRGRQLGAVGNSRDSSEAVCVLPLVALLTKAAHWPENTHEEKVRRTYVASKTRRPFIPSHSGGGDLAIFFPPFRSSPPLSRSSALVLVLAEGIPSNALFPSPLVKFPLQRR